MGFLRFYRGAQVMALGCIPSHCSYFFAYEKLKIYFGVDNEELNLKANICIGCTTTFAHDFFITPSDGNFSYLVTIYL